MTIELGPPLRLAPNPANPTRSIASEFGGTAPYRLSNYLRGGGLVPDTPANAGIPTTLPVRFSDFYGSSQTFVLTVTLTGLVAEYSYDMRAEAVLAGWDETVPLQANVTISGAQGALRPFSLPFPSFPGAPAFIANGAYPGGSAMNLTIDATNSISGYGGNGGFGGSTGSGVPGDEGGTALLTRIPTTITNNGVIGSGGSGGQGGDATAVSGRFFAGGGGGGGAGIQTSIGGGSPGGINGSPGAATTVGAGGSGEAGVGQTGSIGSTLGQAIGAVAIAIDGISHVTFITEGTILGRREN